MLKVEEEDLIMTTWHFFPVFKFYFILFIFIFVVVVSTSRMVTLHLQTKEHMGDEI